LTEEDQQSSAHVKAKGRHTEHKLGYYSRPLLANTLFGLKNNFQH